MVMMKRKRKTIGKTNYDKNNNGGITIKKYINNINLKNN